MAKHRMDDITPREPADEGAFEELIDSEPPNVTEAAPPGDGTEEEAQQIEEDLEQLQREFQTLSDRHLRLAAEFDNYRKRVDRERADAWGRAQATWLRDCSTVWTTWSASHSTRRVRTTAVLQGVQLVERKLRQALEAAGLEPIDPQGAAFDPNTMEAVAMVAAESTGRG
jgi:molecular chaperone GrpE